MTWNTCKQDLCESYTARPDGDYCESCRRLNAKLSENESKSLQKRAQLLSKPKQVRNITVKQLKDSNLWIPFSKYIRLRDSDEYGICTCFTCGARHEWNSGMQAGHFIGRRHWATRYDEQNVHAQCPNCNMYQSGKQYEYGLKLDVTYGSGTSDRLYQLSNKTVHFTQKDIDDLAEIYRNKVKEIFSRLTTQRENT